MEDTLQKAIVHMNTGGIASMRGTLAKIDPTYILFISDNKSFVIPWTSIYKVELI